MKPVIFNKDNLNWNERTEINLNFLRAQENYFNHMLRSRGHVFLNEVYDALNLPRTVDGAISGWLLEESRGDGSLDFGLGGIGDASNLTMTSFNLVFNIDGVIFHRI